jgi:hypothetical protein
MLAACVREIVDAHQPHRERRTNASPIGERASGQDPGAMLIR